MAEVNWDAIPLDERSSQFLIGLLEQPETYKLSVEMSWRPREARDGGPPAR